MANRALDTSEISRLITISDKRANIIDTMQKWPSRENTKLLAQAVKDKLPFVLFNERRFKIKYTTHFNGSVFVGPDDGGFSPCGYFSIDKLIKVLNAIEGLEDYAE